MARVIAGIFGDRSSQFETVMRMKNGSDKTDAVRQTKSPRSRLTTGTVAKRSVLAMQEFRIPRKVPVVASPF